MSWLGTDFFGSGKELFRCDNCLKMYHRDTMVGVGRHRRTYCSQACRTVARMARQRSQRAAKRAANMEVLLR